MRSPLWSGCLVSLLWTVAPSPVPVVLAWFGVVLSRIDLREHRLPDALTLPLYPLLAVLLAEEWRRALLGCLLFGGAHLALRLVSPRAMGGGDVKLAGALGAVLATVSWAALALAAVLASLVTLAIGLVRRQREVPHGPGLLVVTWGLSVL